MPLSEFDIIDAPGQVFSTVVNNRKITIRLRYNTVSEHFSMDLSIDDVPVLTGRKVTSEVDLLQPFDFGIGSIFAADIDGKGREPTLANFVSGITRLYHYVP